VLLLAIADGPVAFVVLCKPRGGNRAEPAEFMVIGSGDQGGLVLTLTLPTEDGGL
jgi:hypothetical protein